MRIIAPATLIDFIYGKPAHADAREIVYRYDVDRVHIVAVLDARRELSGLLLERLIR